MAELIVPTVEELSYHKKLVESPKTMSFSAPIEFPEEKWEEFYKEEVDRDPSERFLAYIFCDGCMDFTGEVSYRYDEEYQGYMAFVLIEKKYRNDGYGEEGLRLLKKEAKNNDIDKFYVRLDKENEAAIRFVEKMGFELIDDKDKLMYLLDF